MKVAARTSESGMASVVRLEIPGPLVHGPEQARSSTFDRLLEAVEAHIAAERESVTSYRGLTTSTSDPVVTLLFQLMLEDEERHHELLRRIAASLRDALRWTHSRDALPPTGPFRDVQTKEAAHVLEGFARHERETAGRFRRLARTQGDLYGGLLALLLETMAADSDKHHRILRFILKRITEEV